MTQTATLRPLREDIDIHPAPPRENGAPCWTLHDITANRFFSVGLDEVRILKHWGAGSPEKVARAASAESPWPIPAEQVEELAAFLAQGQLLQASSARDTEYLLTLAKRRDQGLLKKILHTYLSVRIPLLRPQRLLQAMLPYTAWLFSPVFLLLTVLAGLCGAALVSVRWDEYTSFLPDMLTPSGIISMLLALSLAKVLHEFGHALTATRYGCRVSVMGLAIIVGCPMLYTDATEAWKLSEHGSRLRISLAGLGVELMLAAWALLFWNLVEPGHLRDALFLFSGVTWLVSLAINISPFMRFDGYYLLMDLWGIPNLQTRAFALATWKLRGLIFRVDLPNPDNVPEHTQRLMIIYAVCTWLYRFFLFLGIALVIYAFFFKVLGVVLMVVEIGWFIALPIWREVRAWRTLHKQVSMRPGALVFLGALMTMFFAMPWPRVISMPAMLQLQDEVHVYAPYGGRIEEFSVRPGDMVEAGQVLVRMSSPELMHDLESARFRVTQAELRVNAAGLGHKDRAELSILQEELRTARAALRRYEDEKALLVLVAPRSGRVMAADETMLPGTTAAPGQELLLLATPGAWEIHALAESEDFSRLDMGQTARFLPENPALPAVPCVIRRLDTYADRSLDWPLLAGVHGGQIETTLQDPPVMQTPRHRVLCLPEGEIEAQTRVRGVVTKRIWTESLARRTWIKARVLWESEMGF
jgi:putative peptide zinc metalloprotease protein